MKTSELIPNQWYYSKSLEHNVIFVEIATINSPHKGKAYIEWRNEYGEACGWYVDVEDLEKTK